MRFENATPIKALHPTIVILPPVSGQAEARRNQVVRPGSNERLRGQAYQRPCPAAKQMLHRASGLEGRSRSGKVPSGGFWTETRAIFTLVRETMVDEDEACWCLACREVLLLWLGAPAGKPQAWRGMKAFCAVTASTKLAIERNFFVARRSLAPPPATHFALAPSPRTRRCKQ